MVATITTKTITKHSDMTIESHLASIKMAHSMEIKHGGTIIIQATGLIITITILMPLTLTEAFQTGLPIQASLTIQLILTLSGLLVTPPSTIQQGPSLSQLTAQWVLWSTIQTQTSITQTATTIGTIPSPTNNKLDTTTRLLNDTVTSTSQTTKLKWSLTLTSSVRKKPRPLLTR